MRTVLLAEYVYQEVFFGFARGLMRLANDVILNIKKQTLSDTHTHNRKTQSLSQPFLVSSCNATPPYKMACVAVV